MLMSRNEGEAALPPWPPLPFLVSRATRLNLTKKRRALGTRMATSRVIWLGACVRYWPCHRVSLGHGGKRKVRGEFPHKKPGTRLVGPGQPCRNSPSISQVAYQIQFYYFSKLLSSPFKVVHSSKITIF